MAPADGIAAAAALLVQAKAPLIFAGNGVTIAEAGDELLRIADHLSIPVATTLMAKGIFPEDHPLALGMTGIWGTRVANELARTADVILAVGTAFGEADCSSWNPAHTFAIPPTRLIQIDIDPQEIGKIYPVEVGLVGDAKATLHALATALEATPRQAPAARAARVKEQKEAWQRELAVEQRNSGRPIHPARLLNEISRLRRATRSSSPTSAGTRTERGSSCRPPCRSRSSRAAAWRRWATPRPRRLARRWPRPTGR